MRLAGGSRLGGPQAAPSVTSGPTMTEKHRAHTATVIGNALVDDIVTRRGNFPIFGGAGVNVAVTLAQHGIDTTLVAAVGSDGVGSALRSLLTSRGISLLPEPAPARTARAVVHLEGSEPAYELSEPTYPNFQFSAAARKQIASTDVLVVNAFNYEAGSQVDELRNVLQSSVGWRVLDPNVRPALVRDRGLLVSQVETLLNFSDIVKVSDEDLLAMGDHRSPYPVSRILELGTRVVFLTKGVAGAEILTGAGPHFEAPAFAVAEVVDTVGAGDAAVAALVLSAIAETRALPASREWRAQLHNLDWQAHLKVAMAAAAAACRRRGGPAGAVPPGSSPDQI